MLGIIVAALGILAAQPPPASVGAVMVPMRIINNHVLIDVTLEGAGPFTFIVDSGAGNLVDPEVAAAVGAHVHDRVRLYGVGDAEQNGALTTIHRVTIGAARFSDQRFVVAASHATFAAGEGPPVDGLIGRAIIGSGVTVFDYARQTLTFYAPDDAVSGDGATVLPVSIAGGTPNVPCAVAGVAASCAIDTGSRLNLTVPAPFAEQHAEVLPVSLSLPGIDGYGIGGPAYGRLGRLKSVSFGALSFTGVVADFSVQRRGAFASKRIGANIGGGILRRLTLAFDLPHKRLGLRANADFDAPFPVDRSGLFLIVRDAVVTVLGVRPQTPASRAGIVAGDRIVRAGGEPVPSQALPALRALLEGPADTRVSLSIERGDEPPLAIDLQLSDYL